MDDTSDLLMPEIAVDSWADASNEEDDEEDNGTGVEEEQIWPTKPPYSAFIGSIAPTTTPDDLKSFFEGLSVLRVNMEIPRKQTMPPQWAYVLFENVDDLKAAVGKNGRNLLGRNVSVTIGVAPAGMFDRRRRPYHQQKGNYSGGRRDQRHGYEHRKPQNDRGRSDGARNHYSSDSGRSQYRNSRDSGAHNTRRAFVSRDKPLGKSFSAPAGYRSNDRYAGEKHDRRNDRYSRGGNLSHGGGGRRYGRTQDVADGARYKSTSPSTTTTTTTDAASDGKPAPDTSSRRRVLKLKPRTKPLTSTMSAPESRSSIFGSGHARDAKAFAKHDTTPPAAPSSDASTNRPVAILTKRPSSETTSKQNEDSTGMSRAATNSRTATVKKILTRPARSSSSDGAGDGNQKRGKRTNKPRRDVSVGETKHAKRGTRENTRRHARKDGAKQGRRSKSTDGPKISADGFQEVTSSKKSRGRGRGRSRGDGRSRGSSSRGGATAGRSRGRGRKDNREGDNSGKKGRSSRSARSNVSGNERSSGNTMKAASSSTNAKKEKKAGPKVRAVTNQFALLGYDSESD